MGTFFAIEKTENVVGNFTFLFFLNFELGWLFLTDSKVLILFPSYVVKRIKQKSF